MPHGCSASFLTTSSDQINASIIHFLVLVWFCHSRLDLQLFWFFWFFQGFGSIWSKNEVAAIVCSLSKPAVGEP